MRPAKFFGACPIPNSSGGIAPEGQLGSVDGRRIRQVDRRRRETPGGSDWSAAGRLLASRETGLNAYDGHSGAEVVGWNAADLKGWRYFRGTSANGKVAIVSSAHSPPAWRNWLVSKRILSYEHFEDFQLAFHLYVADTGRERSTVWTKNSQRFSLSPDGTTLATLEFDNPFDIEGKIYLWDIPPRTPGGIVLGLMIGEVGLLIALDGPGGSVYSGPAESVPNHDETHWFALVFSIDSGPVH